jgi:hypothetical protein
VSIRENHTTEGNLELKATENIAEVSEMLPKRVIVSIAEEDSISHIEESKSDMVSVATDAYSAQSQSEHA